MQPLLDNAEAPRVAWERAAGELLSWAAKRIHVIGRTTPVNFRAELERLEALYLRGEAALPRFEYARCGRDDDTIEMLERAADQLERLGPLGALYAARARELALEARMCAAAGTPRLFGLARQRYRRRDRFDEEADVLAARWADHDEEPAGDIISDGSDPRSLLSRLREEIGRRKLPFRVEVSDSLCALAATGAGVVYVARGKAMTPADVERTVLHELEGHARPRARAAAMPLGIFRAGTARGSDEQEGRALGLEEQAGLLCGRRRAELGRRHLCGRSVEAGADFVESARMLMARGCSLAGALRIAGRAHRGGGLARELVYLPALLRVRAVADARIERLLGAGQVSVEAASVLVDHVGC